MSGQDARNTKAVKPAPTQRPRQRRKEARPGEIIDAAIEIFGERGFGATRLEDVALKAGIAKGTLFVYFPNKEELFRAVARSIVSKQLATLQDVILDPDQPIARLIPLLLKRAAMISESKIPAIARLLVADARAFPDVVRVWHDEVASKILALLTVAIERAQERGEVRNGEARLFAFSILGPMMAVILFREVFANADIDLPDPHQMAEQHSAVLVSGLMVPE